MCRRSKLWRTGLAIGSCATHMALCSTLGRPGAACYARRSAATEEVAASSSPWQWRKQGRLVVGSSQYAFPGGRGTCLDFRRALSDGCGRPQEFLPNEKQPQWDLDSWVWALATHMAL